MLYLWEILTIHCIRENNKDEGLQNIGKLNRVQNHLHSRLVLSENQPAVFIDVPLFLCYDNGCMIMNRRKGHFLWEKHQKINQLNIKNIYASAFLPMWARAGDNDTEKC